MSVDLFRPYMAPEVSAYLSRVVTPDEHGRIYCGEGPRVAEFEQQFTELVGAPHPVLAVNSCTSALDLSLHLAGVGLGDEVITTPMTCTATNGVIVNRGGKIVWADVDVETGLINPADVARKISKRTRAIMAVDWAGRSCDYNALRVAALQAHRSLPIIQDAAHNLFPDMNNRGDYVCWSFQAIKHLTTGDGGAMLVPRERYDRARLLRWYGLDRTSSADFRCAQSITEAGFKYHMNDVAASIGLANLPHAAWIVEQHRQHAAFYAGAIQGEPGTLFPPPSDLDSSWWLYTVLVSNPQSFIAHLAMRGVAASPVHARNDTHPAFYFPSGPLPGVDQFAGHEVAIPVHWALSQADLEQVAVAVNEWVGHEVEVRQVGKELVSMSG